MSTGSALPGVFPENRCAGLNLLCLWALSVTFGQPDGLPRIRSLSSAEIQGSWREETFLSQASTGRLQEAVPKGKERRGAAEPSGWSTEAQKTSSSPEAPVPAPTRKLSTVFRVRNHMDSFHHKHPDALIKTLSWDRRAGFLLRSIKARLWPCFLPWKTSTMAIIRTPPQGEDV